LQGQTQSKWFFLMRQEKNIWKNSAFWRKKIGIICISLRQTKKKFMVLSVVSWRPATVLLILTCLNYFFWWALNRYGQRVAYTRLYTTHKKLRAISIFVVPF
jgi:hypothetical protein